MSESKLQKLMLVYVANAKKELSSELFSELQLPVLQAYLVMAQECLPMEDLLDPVLLRHTLDSLTSAFTAEETLLHVFTLFLYKKLGMSRVHPLELGILKQQVQGLMPVFEKGVEQGKIKSDYFHQYRDMQLNLVEQTELATDVLMLLDAEYKRFLS